MRRIVLLLLMALATSVLAEVPRGGPKYQTDSGTVSLLRRYLVSAAKSSTRSKPGSGSRSAACLFS
jgi:hypothetical protein